MTDAISAVVNSLNNNITQLNWVSQNVANLNSSGYQAVVPFSQISEQNPAIANVSIKISDAPGTLNETGNKLDFAIIGEGYFTLKLGKELFYSKNGAFNLDGNGQVLHASGAVVMTQQGELNIGEAQISAKPDGTLFLDKAEFGRFSIVQPLSNDQLILKGNGLYQITGATKELESPVKQGTLVTSNVSSSHEMIQMIQLSRHSESLQKVVLAYDQMLNTGINQIGKR